MRRNARVPSRGFRAWYRRRIVSPINQHPWTTLLVLWGVSFGLGVWGYWIMADGDAWLPQVVYQSLQLFTFKGGEKFGEAPWQLEVARWTSPAIAAYTAMKGLVGVFYQQAQVLRASLARNHVIVCGLGDKGRLIASTFLQLGIMAVIIDKDGSRGKTAASRAEGAIVLEGAADEPSVLRSAGIARAAYLIATCDDDTNVEIVHQARRLRSGSGRPLACIAHVSAGGLQDRLWRYQQATKDQDDVAVMFFNVERSGARTMVSRHSGIRLDTSVPCDARTMLVRGEDPFTRHFIDAIAERWFVRTVYSGEMLRMVPFGVPEMTLIAESQAACPEMWGNIVVAEPGSGVEHVERAFVLCDSSAQATVDTIDLLARMPQDALIVVRHQREAGLAHVLEGDENDGRVEVFSVYEDTCTDADLLLGARAEALAKLIHETYRVQNPGKMPAWDRLDESLKAASREQADWLERMLEDVEIVLYSSKTSTPRQLELSEPLVERLADIEHRRWSADKITAGWRYGAARDDSKRLHPDLVPWDSLPEREREKDRVLVRGWPVMLSSPTVGFGVCLSPVDGSLERAS